MLKSTFFSRNRSRLKGLLPKGALAIFHSNDQYLKNGDDSYPFIQNADLYYLSGINQEETTLVLFPKASKKELREILFIRDRSETIASWEGEKENLESASSQSGIKTVKWMSELDPILNSLIPEASHLFFNGNEHPRAERLVDDRNLRESRKWRQAYPLHHTGRLAPIMHQLRQIKSSEELKEIRSAISTTSRGLERVLKKIQPGMTEKMIEAEWAHSFISEGEDFAYSPIIASGVNSCTLHYTTNHAHLEDGELLLMDVAATCGNYHSDLTRTVPINGKFTKRQLAVYEAVLRVQQQVIDYCRPGLKLAEVQEVALELVAKELFELKLLKKSDLKNPSLQQKKVKQYYMHGIGHSIGLGTHDVTEPDPRLSLDWVITIEPGIYIKEEKIGIRLENMIQIQKTGSKDMMKSLPLDPGDIEKAMKGTSPKPR
ncbi:MAG: aminopeptidase P family protein [Verrucomicrobiota bacterium]